MPEATPDPQPTPGAGVTGTDEPSAVAELLAVNEFSAAVEPLMTWLGTHLLTVEMAIQAGLIVAALVPAALFGPRLKAIIVRQVAQRVRGLERIARALALVATPLALYLILGVSLAGLRAAGYPVNLIDASLSLLTAWIVIRLVTLIIRSPFWSSVAFYVAWPIAALDAFNVLDDVARQLQTYAIPLGKNQSGEPVDLSVLDLARSLMWFAVLFFAASTLGRFIEARLAKADEMTPALRTLVVKILNVVLPVLALLVALQIVGFNLATLTVFGGAVGLGIGLGLQRIVANFIAGFTLIADKSIRPRDVIEIDDTFGWVTGMHARYVTLRTRDGTEHLIPNERFMEEGVINWSRSDTVVRMHVPFGVSYATEDMELVQKLAIEAAASADRVVSEPAPVCNLTGFGDSSVDFDLRMWIRDPANGMSNVRSQVYLALWKRLREHDIDIPFPQRDLHVRSWQASAEPQQGEPVGDGGHADDTSSRPRLAAHS